MKERKARADENFAVMKIAQLRQHFGWEVIATSENQNRLTALRKGKSDRSLKMNQKLQLRTRRGSITCRRGRLLKTGVCQKS
jgi:hypothetical protein